MSSNRSDLGGSSTDRFPVRLARWLAANGDVLDALVVLRRLGPEAADALEAARNIRRVAVMRLSLGLWSAQVAGEGADPHVLLADHIPTHLIDRVRFGVGDEVIEPVARHLRAVVEVG